MKNILIVDDEVNISQLLSKFLIRNGYNATIASSGASATEQLSQNAFDLVLCDFRLEDSDGREMLKHIKAHYPQTAVIIITGYSDIKLAVELIKMGAYDYITKPLYPDEILNTINKVLSAREVIVKPEPAVVPSVNTMPDMASIKDGYIVGNTETSLELLKQIELIAPTNYSVILFGESGTGKEEVAKAIHRRSNRADMPFVALDCGSLTKELAGSEFFGHEKGSFTGALFSKTGHFELANGGTLFLDEVGNLPYDIQALLLRAVQERKVRKIGGSKEMDVDVRIIVATNENLQLAIQNGKFREDLFHRFNEFNISIPALRNRGQDMMLFANTFLALANQEQNKQVQGFTPEAEACLLEYGWPGNIRELKNVMRRATLLTSEDLIELKALPLEIANYSKLQKVDIESNGVNFSRNELKNAAQEAESETIIRVLKEVNFNKTKAAERLNIDRKTLYNKMKAANLI